MKLRDQHLGKDGHGRTTPNDPTLGITRRGFLATAGAALAAAALPRTAESRTPDLESGRSPQPIGLQLYTVRDLIPKNFEYTLNQVAAIGYQEVEFAGLFDKKPDKVAGWLKKAGLVAPASHIALARLRTDLQGVVDEAQALGNDYVVCPSIDGPPIKDVDGYKRLAADFTRIGQSLQRVGLRFTFHNHDAEFKPLATGELPYDILLAESEPRSVKFEMDLYWITKGGKDPLEYFAKYPGRFPLVHVKDMTGGGAMTNVGQGHIDWGRIFAKRREAGIDHLFVENDEARSPMMDAKISYDYLARLDL
jgi:sugar phosphate isomerase/epimerase